VADGPERTAEEREAARRERELRRAEAAGQTAPEAADEEVVHDLDEEVVYDDDEQEAVYDPGEEAVYDHEEEFDEEHEVPSGTRRVSHAERRRMALPHRPRRRPSKRLPTDKHSVRGRAFALVALVVAAALVWFLIELFQPFHGAGHGSVTVTIPPHSSASDVGDLLARDGVVSSSFFFQLRATLAGERGDLRAGTYHLQMGMSYGDVLKTLTTAPPGARVTDLTLIPGRTRRQIDSLLRSQGVAGSYFRDSRSSPLLDPHAYGAPRRINSLEGFLFPDTYRLVEPVSVSVLVSKQLTEFKQQFRTVNFGYARSKNLTPYDVLTIASMIEAEAQTRRDRALVASVIYNRLRNGMPLQLDATTCYLVGGEPCRLTGTSLLNSPSPYNTRIHKGLPPTPIDNPSLAAIQAAANPAHTNYLYFVVKPCGNGEMVFESDYQKFLADAARYQAARSKHGGRSPATCR
jgi:uncharacterized YceG family protein